MEKLTSPDWFDIYPCLVSHVLGVVTSEIENGINTVSWLQYYGWNILL